MIGLKAERVVGGESQVLSDIVARTFTCDDETQFFDFFLEVLAHLVVAAVFKTVGP